MQDNFVVSFVTVCRVRAFATVQKCFALKKHLRKATTRTSISNVPSVLTFFCALARAQDGWVSRQSQPTRMWFASESRVRLANEKLAIRQTRVSGSFASRKPSAMPAMKSSGSVFARPLMTSKTTPLIHSKAHSGALRSALGKKEKACGFVESATRQ